MADRNKDRYQKAQGVIFLRIDQMHQSCVDTEIEPSFHCIKKIAVCNLSLPYSNISLKALGVAFLFVIEIGLEYLKPIPSPYSWRT